MWYRFCLETKLDADGKPMGLEEKILRLDAEKAVREKLILKKDYSPTEDKVKILVNKTIAKLKEDYRDLSVIRNTLDGEDLYPVVKKYVTKAMENTQKKKKSIF